MNVFLQDFLSGDSWDEGQEVSNQPQFRRRRLSFLLWRLFNQLLLRRSGSPEKHLLTLFSKGRCVPKSSESDQDSRDLENVSDG